VSSGTVLTGTEGFTSMTNGSRRASRCSRLEDKPVEACSRQGGVHDRLGGDIGARTRPVLDHELLAEPLRRKRSERCVATIASSVAALTVGLGILIQRATA